MADMVKEFTFQQAKHWELQDALHNPVPSPMRGYHLPDTVKVERIVAPGESCVRAEIVPDQTVHGIEWPMHHTIPEFSRKVVDGGKLKIPQMTA